MSDYSLDENPARMQIDHYARMYQLLLATVSAPGYPVGRGLHRNPLVLRESF